MSNRDTLLEFVLPLEIITPTPDVNIDYVRNVAIIVKPKDENVTSNHVYRCNTKGETTLITNSPVGEMLDNMSEIYLIPQDEIDLTVVDNLDEFNFFTVLIDPAFSDAEYQAAIWGDYEDVIGFTTSNRDLAATEAIKKNHVAFYELGENTGVNMYEAFSHLLGSRDWENQQYIELPEEGVTNDVNIADALFNSRISFGLNSKQYGTRLAFFAVGGHAIIAPYVLEILNVRLQARALRFINLNKPQYTLKNAKNLEDDLQELIDTDFVDTELIAYGTVTCSLGVAGTTKNFVVNLDGDIAEPTALWRVFGKLIQGSNV